MKHIYSFSFILVVSLFIPQLSWAITNPVGLWNLDEGSGQVVTDISGVGNNGTLGSASVADTHDPTWVAGLKNGALDFDGVDDFVAFGSATNLLRKAQAASVSVWVKNTLGGGNDIAVDITQGSTFNSRFEIQIRTTGDVLVGGAAGDTESFQMKQTSSSPIATDTWHHVVGVIDYTNDSIKIYVDGVEQSATGTVSFIASETSDTSPMGMFFGVNGGGGASFYDGVIDEVAVFNRILSPSEILDMFTFGSSSSGSGGGGSSSGSSGAGGGASNVPAAPSNVSLKLDSVKNDVAVIWLDNANDETEFKVFRQSKSGSGSWMHLKSVGVNVTQYIDAAVPAGDYEYQVFACNANGCSVGSSIVNITVPPLPSLTPPPPPPPSSTTSTQTSPTNTTVQGKIAGTVVTQNGQGLAGIEVSAWMPEGSGFAGTKTDSAGNFSLLVAAGKWEVYAKPSLGDLYNPEPPKRINVEAGKTVTVKFMLYPANATISGTVVDAGGSVLTAVSGFVELATSAQAGTSVGGAIDKGIFSFKAPAGTYVLSVFLPSGSPYTPGPSQTVTLTAGQTTPVQIRVSQNTSQITGTLQDEGGIPATGFSVRIFATSKSGVWREASFDKATGMYALTVAPGTWYLGYEIDPSAGYISLKDPNVEVTVAGGATAVKNLIVRKAGSIIRGQVTDPNGNAVSRAFVGISKISFAGAIESQEFKDPIVAGAETDSGGFYTIALPAGDYFIKTFVRPDLGFINSRERSVSVGQGVTQVVNLQLRSSERAITGRVLLGGSPVRDAFVWAWSKEGGYQESSLRADGTFRLNVTAGSVWVVSGGSEIDGVHYKAGETPIEVGTVDIVHDIHVERFRTLVTSTSRTVDAAQSSVVEATGGASVVAPASSVGTSGTVSISVTPDTRTPSQGERKVVGVAYNLEARDAAGQTVVKFNSEVTVTIPYNEQDVAALGTTEDYLGMSFWDENVGTWKPIENSVVNKADNFVSAAVDHFTRFAVIASADIVPPSAPINIVPVALGNGQIRLTWQNPAADFHHATVYRSETVGTLGSLHAAEVLTNSFVDQTNIIDGVLYYYTVRAVDAVGNESVNTNQISILAVGSSTQEPGLALPPGQAVQNAFLRSLAVGSTGADVKALQQLLNAQGFVVNTQGVGSPGSETEFFGNLTAQAVARFQEAYASEILTPLGLSRGTGFFGESTRRKANELLGASGAAPITPAVPLPPAQTSQGTFEGEFLRSLTVGSRGEDVQALQQFLLDEGVYPEGLVTGFFGQLTQQAVARFQEKYSSEILAPLGLTRGTGFFGSSTRTKVNDLLEVAE